MIIPLMAEAQSRITVTRTGPEDVQRREIIVKVDDEEIARLAYGKSVTQTVPPGRHVLVADNTWNKKKVEMNLTAGEHARFRAFSRAGRFTWVLVSMIGAGPMYVSLEREA